METKHCKGFLPRIVMVLLFQGFIAFAIFAINYQTINKAANLPAGMVEVYLTEALSRCFINSFVLLLAGLIIAIAVTYYFNKGFLKSLLGIVDVIEKVEKGSLSSRVDTSIKGGMCELGKLLNSMISKIEGTIASFYFASTNIGSASKNLTEIYGSVNDMVNHVNDSVVSVSSAAEELNATGQNVLDMCRNSSESIRGCEEQVVKGKNVITESRHSMEDISTGINSIVDVVHGFQIQSQEIGQIVVAINEIADQTNLLALNAAIEAARAGDHGRGFAVVADEVRKLAGKTSDSTKQIEDVIKDLQKRIDEVNNSVQSSVDKVNNGISLSDNSVEAIEEINDYIRNVSVQIDGIVRSKEEESLALSDVTSSTAAISAQTVDIIKVVQESFVAGENLAELAETVARKASGFKSDKMKEFMPWSADLELGVKMFDDQHKELVKLINKLYDAMKDNRGEEVLLSILDKLVDYTVYHFDNEEEMFAKYGYENRAQHIKIHTDLKKTAMDLKQKIVNGETVIGFNVISFLENWVKNHILVEDRKYIELFKKKGL